METAVNSFELRPSIKTTVKRDIPELSVKQGDEVTLTHATLDGTRARFSGHRQWPVLADYNLSDAESKRIKDQAQARKREAAAQNSGGFVASRRQHHPF